MSVKHFCDRCERAMVQEDFDPFIRVDIDKQIIVSVVAMTPTKEIINDLCNRCKIDIVCSGVPNTEMAIPHRDHAAPPPPPPPIAEEVATVQPTTFPAESKSPYVPSMSPAVQPTTLPSE